MLKKLVLVTVLLTLSVLALAQGVANFAPSNSNFVMTFKNNGQNYTALKNVPIFSFLLSDLGIESLAQSSIDQTISSIGMDPSKVWNALGSDFVLFGMDNTKSEMGADLELAFKTEPDVIFNLLNALVGGNIGSKTVNGTAFKTYSIDGNTFYALGHAGYALISNSTDLIMESVSAYDGKTPSFKPSESEPQNTWISAYMQGTPSVLATDTKVEPVGGYVFGLIDGNSLKFTGTEKLDYKDPTVKADILKASPNAYSLETTQATGDLWLALDMANPVDFYNNVEPYLKEHMTSAEQQDLQDLVDHLNGKLFLNVGNIADNGDYVGTIFLKNSITDRAKIAKQANASFKWNGNDVYRFDTTDGTKTVHDYMIMFPDKLVLSNMQPANSSKYFQANSKAQDMGNYSQFARQVWKNAFLLGYMDLGKIINGMLQYSVDSGLLVQSSFDKNGNMNFELIIR